MRPVWSIKLDIIRVSCKQPGFPVISGVKSTQFFASCANNLHFCGTGNQVRFQATPHDISCMTLAFGKENSNWRQESHARGLNPAAR